MPAKKVRDRVLENRPKEKQALLLFLFFFFVVAAFWTLKPLRTSSVVKEFGIELYPLLKQGLVVIVPIIFAVYSALTERLSRKELVNLATTVFFVSSLLFSVLLTYFPSSGVRLAFFFYVDTYITVMVTVFWTYVNDLFEEVGARMTYGFVGTGGLAGGLLGALVSGWASEFLGTHIVLVSALFMLPIFVIVWALERGAPRKAQGPAVRAPKALDGKSGRTIGKTITEGATAVAGSKYLLAIVVMVGAYEVISTIVDFQFTSAASAAYESRDAMAGFQGKVFFVGQAASMGVQLLLTGFIHRRFGAAAGLAFLPVALLLGSGAMLLAPGLAVAAFAIGSEATFGYSINQTSKELLYVPLDPVARFKGKAFIDMFVMRLAKTLGALILIGHVFWLEPSGVGPWVLSLVALGLVLFWLLAVRYVGRTLGHEKLLAPKPAPAAVAASTRRPVVSTHGNVVSAGPAGGKH